MQGSIFYLFERPLFSQYFPTKPLNNFNKISTIIKSGRLSLPNGLDSAHYICARNVTARLGIKMKYNLPSTKAHHLYLHNIYIYIIFGGAFLNIDFNCKCYMYIVNECLSHPYSTNCNFCHLKIFNN